ncbi:MAG: ABC transporter ATP-binding protein/permease [Bacteroidia bacterium]|nr:ABC transporter ATP-binding protein/permease [Bacteroidia bacterium]
MNKFFKLLRYVKPYTSKAILNVLFNLFSIVAGLFSFTLVIPFLELIFKPDKLVTQPPVMDMSFNSIKGQFSFFISEMVRSNGPSQALLFVCLLIVVMVSLKNLFRYLALYFMVPLRTFVIRDIRRDLYDKILRLPLSYFSDERKGDLITRMSSDVQEIEVSIMSSIEAIFKEPLTIVVFVSTLVYMSPQLTLFVLLSLPVTAFIIARVAKTLRKQSNRSQSKLGEMISMFEETLSGMRIIKAFNAEESFGRKFNNENDLLAKLSIWVNRRRDASSPLSESMSVVVLVLILWFGGQMVLANDGKLSAEVFIAYIAIFSQVITPAKGFSTAYYNVQKGAASVDRIDQIMHSPERITDTADAISDVKFARQIEFRNVSFAYDKEKVLDEINLTIEKGKTVALVGPSGSGKSTLADLVPRFYDPTEGEILIDGVPVKHYKIAELRKLMGIVTQEAILFNETIFNNIAFGMNHAQKEEVEKAARIANAHDFILEQDKQYLTNIGDRGNKLSGGQRQRLSIARAVMRNPEILILDEATSALDTTSERLVQDALSNVMKGRTSIVIAHRLSTIQNADMIVVIDKGKIVQKGTHTELLNQPGLYKELNEMQKLLEG